MAQWNYILVAGEEEMETGTVDVRTRDTERHGKMRVDKLVEHLKTLDPAKSQSFENFYKQAWNADKYKDVPLPKPKESAQEVAKEESKE